MADSDPGKLLLGAGVVTWVVSGAPAIASWAAGRTAFDGRAVVWCAAYAAFAVAFVIATTAGRFGKRGRVAALCVQSVSALAICTLGHSGFEGALLCVVAGEAPLLLGGRAALIWVVTQMAALLAIELATWGNVRGVYFSAGAYAGFQAFTFGASRLAAREAAARQELARVHAELLATQELFADSTRTAERLRIARELHDALGHHLTALSLQLELARNVVDGRAKAPVEEAHGLTKTLLAELRTVVSTMREDHPIDLAGALRTLASGIPRPRVHLDLPDELCVDPALAHTLFRCAQEALTNTVRHADADNVYLAIEERDGSIALVARDDGRGARAVTAGHGLTGLRERIEGMGGRVEVSTSLGEGVTLRAHLPLRGGAT